MVIRIAVQPQLLKWACERSGIAIDDIPDELPMLSQWLSGAKQPTLKQLEGFARKTHTPVGYLFLDTPPIETIPIPDFRTHRNKKVRRPSANLLDTIYGCQERQDWYRAYQHSNGEEALSFIGSLTLRTSVVAAANTMRGTLGFRLEDRSAFATWEEALRQFVEQAEAIGVLVMTNGVVGSNTHRTLDPKEFRGFALVDPLAPVVFVNGADSKSAQMFTLAHELAHVWLGKTALSDVGPETQSDDGVESWCNQVAAELLVPMVEFRRQFKPSAELPAELKRLARVYKVSTLVILRRVLDLGGISKRDFNVAYEAELARIAGVGSSGGNFYSTAPIRVSKRFLRAIIASTYSGHTLFTDAFRMVGFQSSKAFSQLATNLGIR
jgi:Zn-dependent peptidase ImmA (M78 family)